MFGFIRRLLGRKDVGELRELSPEATRELARELERGASPDADAEEPGWDLTSGIGLLRLGMSELLPGWVALFGRSRVYAVDVGEEGKREPFAFCPPDDETYLLVFTSERLAGECVSKMPAPKSIIPFVGLDLLREAEMRKLGVWINPLSEACMLRIGARKIPEFIHAIPQPAPQPPPLPVEKKAPIALGKGNPGVFDGPKNDLERALLAVRNREMETLDFLEYLLNSNVFIAVPDGQFREDGGEMKLVGNPILFSMCYEKYTAVAVFTHQSRIDPVQRLHPEFHYAVEMPAADIILKGSGLSGSFGLAINPYWDVNLEWSAEQMDGLREMIAKGN